MNSKDRITLLEMRVRKLEQEVAALKTGGAVATPEVPPVVDTSYTARAMQSSAAVAHSATTAMPAASTNGSTAGVYNQQEMRETPVSRPQKTSLEDKIGKNVMGIVASVLVFLSLIFLGIVIYDFIPDIVKIVIMYAISGGLAALGLIKMNKEGAYKTFFTAMAGCGLGAIYISLLLTHYTFGILPVMGLAVLLFLWTMGTAALSRFKSPIFTYICYAGLTIATILGAVQWHESPLGIIFYGISIAVLFAFNVKKEYKGNAFFFIQLPIMSILLSALYSDSFVIRLVVLLVPIFALIAQNLYFSIDKATENIYLPVSILTYLSILVSMAYMSNEIGSDIINPVFSILFIVLAVILYFAHMDDETQLPFLFAYYMTIGILLYTMLEWLWIPAVILLAISFIKPWNHFRYAGYAYILLSVLQSGYMFPTTVINDNGAIVLLICTIAIITAALIIRKEDNVIDRYILTGLSVLIPFTMLGNELINLPILILLLAVISFICNSKAYYTNPSTGEIVKASQIIGFAINGITIVLALTAIDNYIGPLKIYAELPGVDWLTGLLLIVVGTALVLRHTSDLFDLEVGEMGIGIYIGVKISLLIYAILHRIDAAGFLISIIGIIVAVLFVIIGFRIKRKPFRLYGLGLSLVCVAKLILVDIHYSTSLLRPLGFLGAGALCFGISWIYSRLEKKEAIEDENTTLSTENTLEKDEEELADSNNIE